MERGYRYPASAYLYFCEDSGALTSGYILLLLGRIKRSIHLSPISVSPFASPWVNMDAHLVVEFAISATTFLVYDTVINFADEVEYIWCRRGLWMKFVYVFLRHITYLITASIVALSIFGVQGKTWDSRQCIGWTLLQLVSNQVITIVVEGILVFRICAMYNRNKWILIVISILYAGVAVTMAVACFLSVPNAKWTPQCLVTDVPPIYGSYWIISVSFETLLFCLTLYRCYISSQNLGQYSILFSLMRDGTWAYAMMFAIMLINLLMYHYIHSPLAGLCFVWELAIMSFAGSHILLNLRRLAAPENELSISDDTSTMVFADSQSTQIPERHFRVSPNDIELQAVQRGDDIATSDSGDATLLIN